MDAYVVLMKLRNSPLFWMIVLGLIARFVVGILFTFPYDCGNWAKIAETIVAGEDLYERPDNYYAPIWGYLLSFLAMIYTQLGGSSFANQFDELTILDGFRVSYYGSVMIEPAFGMLIKTTLFLVDLAVAFVIRRIVLELGSSERRANVAFGIWFLCPLVIYCSGVYLIFDTIEVLFLALAFLMLIWDRPFICGAMMLMAGMVKPFAFYLVPLFLAYFLLSHPGVKEKLNYFALTAGGFLSMFLVIFMPVLVNGEFMDSLTFLTGRVDSAGTVIDNGMDHIISVIINFESQVFMWLQPVIIGAVVWLAVRYYRKGEQDMDRLIKYAAISFIIVFLWPETQQCYYLLIVFMIALMVLKWEPRKVAGIMLLFTGLSVFYMLLTHNMSVLLPLAAYTDLISIDWVLDKLFSFNLATDIFGGNFYDDSRRIVQVVIAGVMLYLGYMFIMWGEDGRASS